MEPSGTAFQAQAEALARDEASVREIALRMVRPQSAVGESAESKAIDKTQLDTQACQLRRRSGRRGSLCWKLAARWLGAKEDGIEAKYNESYDVGEATGEDQRQGAREERPRVIISSKRDDSLTSNWDLPLVAPSEEIGSPCPACR